MKKNIYLILTIILISIVTIFSINYLTSKESINEQNPLVLLDTAGKEVTLSKYPERIISLIPSATENIYDLGAGELLVAVDSYSNYPENTKDLTKIETNTNLNIESIINLKPDVIFMSKMGQTIEQYTNLIDANIKVVMVDASSIEETYTMIKLIGKVVNKEERAEEIISGMRKDFEDLSNSVKDNNTKTVYYEISPLEFGLWTSGKNTFENEIMEILNIKNIFSDLDGWKEISQEQVLAKDPEYIITTTSDFGNIKSVDEIISRENWSNINAVKTKNVYNIDPDIMSRPTARLLEGAKELKKLIHGE